MRMGRFDAISCTVLGGAIALALSASCGSRSALLVDSRSDVPDAAAGSGGSAGFGGTAGAGTGGGSAGVAGLGGSAGVGGQTACLALATGNAVELLSFPDRHATAPSAVLLPELSPPRVAIQAFASGGWSTAHSDIQVARFVTSEASPSGLEAELSPMLVGIESHGWANMVHAPGTLRELLLTWHGDPGGYGRPMFRRIEIDGWSPGSAVDIAGSGEAVLDTAPGQSLGPSGFGYAGNGYAVVWRRVPVGGGQTDPVVAVVDENGQPVIGPHAVAPPTAYPGRSPSVLWSGVTYLLATSFGAEGIELARLRPPSGDLWDDSGIELANAIVVPKGMRAGRPALALAGSNVILAWLERPLEGIQGPSRVRVVRASADGNLIIDSGTNLPVGAPESRVTLHAGSAGVIVSWSETGDAALPDSMAGRSRIMVVRLAPGLDAPAVWSQIASPRFHDYAPPHTVSRGTEGGLTSVWSGRAMSGGLDVVYGARLDCVPHAEYDVQYEAFWGPPTALDRLFVIKRDFTRNVCFRIGLASPSSLSEYSVAAPAPWAVEWLGAESDAFGCAGPGWSPETVPAIGGSGAIDWPDSQSGALPCTLDIGVSLTFAPDAPWLPASELMSVSALPVVSAPCGG
jgi:hypothetical protein